MTNNEMISWFASVVALFDKILSALMAFSPLGVFLDVALFLAVLAFFAWLVRRGSHQRF